MRLPFIGSVNTTLALSVLVVLGVAGTAATVLVLRNQSPSQPLVDLTIAVTQTDLTVKITAGGTVVPVRSVNLSPKTSGILVALPVEQGDMVTAGQVVGVMDSRDIDAQLLQAEGNLRQAIARLEELENGSRSEDVDRAQAQAAQAQAQITEAQSRLALAQQRLQRNQALFAEGAISQDDLEASINSQEQAQSLVTQAQAGFAATVQQVRQLENGARPEAIAQAAAQVQAAQGQRLALQVQKADTIIRTPFAGLITQRYADPGAFVTPTTSASTSASATSTSIVALAQGLEVLANVPEGDIRQLYGGQLVEVLADSFPGETFAGKIRLIAPEAVKEQNVTSFQVRIELLNGQDRLKSGMNVDVSFVGDRLNNTLVVPTVAIVTQGGKAGVLVPNPRQEPVFRPITVGTTVGDQTQVIEGLTADDRVFIELPPGQSFEDIKPEVTD
ncbi:efflux RND transporter periplasmic adaptor subunit [Prochlorothrix hollandica]|uniref:RND transporter n=1 Tax=Prochlorothrix hollandica PCC 9006 = CALU 1027 TaxID=317619 RepID=A0A0M2PY28_PROHO|nr:efflux RND transporter periplasmic adaptor subunit [Prochlorothrix hollandica]KKI99583.1 RND transporter [Prochlorothrix hollandica PCC 9006 = CALU 1027]